MKKIFWLIIIIGLIGSFMTNPNEDDFKEFLTQKFTKELKQNDEFGGTLSFLASPGTFIASLSLKKEDYKLCSTYSYINFKGKEEKYFGFFKNFIKI